MERTMTPTEKSKRHAKIADNGNRPDINNPGQIVYENTNNLSVGNHKINVNTSSWSKGMYFCTVITGIEKSITKVLVE